MTSILQAAGYALTKSAIPSLSPFVGVQNCSGFPGSTYALRGSKRDHGLRVRKQAYSLHRMSSTKALDFPLQVAKLANRR